jgi:hypothetical protein
MKALTVRYLPLAVMSAGLALFAGCSKHDTAEAKADIKDAYADTKAATAKAWENIKDYTYDKRSDFSAQAKAATSSLDADITKLRTEYSEAQASASRKAAMAELKDSEADYHKKLEALGTATADTWDSAKKNVMLAWDKTQAAYYKARAN